MSVLKRKRNISKMEFYHNAIKLRLMMTEFLLRDFGIKSRRRNLDFAKDVYDMEDEDISQIEVKKPVIEKPLENKKQVQLTIFDFI